MGEIISPNARNIIGASVVVIKSSVSNIFDTELCSYIKYRRPILAVPDKPITVINSVSTIKCTRFNAVSL